MATWKYSLDVEGKQLRALINKGETVEDIVEIYNQLITCLESLKRKLRKPDAEVLESEIETMIEDLQYAMPDTEDSDLTYEDEEENLNCYLRDFYDMCDGERVWVGI
jgi:hypothetical protein